MKRHILLVLSVFIGIVGMYPGVCAYGDPPPTGYQWVGPPISPNSVQGLHTSLSVLLATHHQLGVAESMELAQARGLVFDGNMVEVMLEPSVEHQAASIAKASVIALGGIVTGESRSLLRVKLPIGRLEEATSSIGGLRMIREPIRPIELAVGLGTVVSEAVGLTGADVWQTLGYDGTGVKVAVIDAGFANLSGVVSAGDIPASYIGRDYTGTGLETDSNHGTAVAEAVCDMAPGIQLYCLKIGD
ncbi:MAG: hypothetical protein ACYSWP_01615, partial [Planctomycetota bacterium]